jgi:GNAT superfamily N-acetyltransferase
MTKPTELATCGAGKLLFRPTGELSRGELDRVISRALHNWLFLLHPLSSLNYDAVKHEYARKLRSLAELETLEKGRLHFASFETTEGAWFIGLRKLPWDSDFFGFPIGRLEPFIHPHRFEIFEDALTVAKDLVRTAIKTAQQYHLQHLTATADPADAITIFALEECGFRLKDTVNYHLFDLAQVDCKQKSSRVRLATIDDVTPLGEFTLRMFGDRQYIKNRFNSDPQYPKDKVAEMYKVWIEKSVRGELANAVFVIDCDDDVPVGYVTAILPSIGQIDSGIALGDMALMAVAPTYQRQGLNRILIVEALSWFKEKGLRYALTRTASTTAGVNKNSLRAGSIDLR